jgi:hypothetical protein
MAWTTIDVEAALDDLGAEHRRHLAAGTAPAPVPAPINSAVVVSYTCYELARGLRDARRELHEALAAAQAEADTMAVLMKFRMGAALDPRLDEEQLLVECMTLLHLGGVGIIPQQRARDAVMAMLEGWQQRHQLAVTGRLAVA